MKQTNNVLAIYQNQHGEVRTSPVTNSLTCGWGAIGQGYQAVVYAIDQQAGKGNANFAKDVTPPLMAESNGTPHAVCFRLSSTSSNGWKSDNPKSGCYETDVACTLDTKVYPTCNQGGGIRCERRLPERDGGQ